VQAEIDEVLGDRDPTMEDLMSLEYTRLVIAETLRMYPEPPLLIRRCRTEDVLPRGHVDNVENGVRCPPHPLPPPPF
jgi:cytochrome P450